MGRRKKRKNPSDYLMLPDFYLDEGARRSIWIVILLVLGLVCLFGLFNLSGNFGQFLSKWLTIIFGYGKFLVPIILFYWASLIIKRGKKNFRFNNYLGLVFLFLSYQTLFHFFFAVEKWLVVAKDGSGGGYIGYYFSRVFFYVFGFWGGVAVLVALFLISLVLIFNTSLNRIIGRESFILKIFQPFITFFRELFKRSNEEEYGDNEDKSDFIDEAREEVLGAWEKREVDDVSEEGDEPIIPAKAKSWDLIQEKISWPKKFVKIDLPIELLNNRFFQAIGGDTNLNSQKIKDTLDKFGIEVEMGETKIGPTVTQYTFRPAEGVKLSRITTLSNDLSLALAAHPIRIEAPIPGKSLVGIEVPNRAKAIVGLREILEDKNFKKRKNNLCIALGKDVAGNACFYDLNRMPHLLVAGATNSGKSVCLNAIITSLLYQNSPNDLRFIMVDPKRVELPVYNGIPHLLTPVITEVSKTINSLKWCLNEMDRRYNLLNKSGKKNINSYNQSAKEKLPYIVYIIDELADFMMTAGKEMEAATIRLAQMSRAIGIHLILATQRPSVDVITGLIKANIPSRIAFSVASLVDSKTILDVSGAEKLLGQGDMLFTSAELSKPKRIQGAFLSEAEINDIVNYIKEKSGQAEYLEGITDRQKVSGIAGVGLDGVHGDEDELFEEAKEIIIRAGKASTSMLQRRLSIGYGRAAKILDMLEDSGIIGPANGSKPREVLLSQEEYETQGAVSAMPIHNRNQTPTPDSYFADSEKDDNEEGNDESLYFNHQFEENGDNGIEKNSEEDFEENKNRKKEEEVIDNEDKILEEIREKDNKEKQDKDQTKSEPNPLDEDDEMFFAK